MNLKVIYYNTNNYQLNYFNKKNIFLFTSYKLLKKKFIILFFITFTKTFINILINSIIVFDYIIDITKEFRIAFTKIFGISLLKCEQLKKLFGITTTKIWKLNQLESKLLFEINYYFNLTTLAGFNLIKLINFEKEKFLETRCFKRNRYLLGLPANGQRTHTNALTARKFKLKI